MEISIEIQFIYKIPHNLNRTKETYMKTALIFIFVFSCTFLSAVTILAEDFTSTTFPPTGWTIEAPQPAAWTRSATASAGGTVGELYLNYTPFAYGTYKFISPSFDSSKMHDMSLSFRHCLSDYGSIVTYTIGVMVYSGTTGWSTIWSDVSSTHIPATQMNLTIPYSLGRSADTKIAFFFEGNNYDINWWVIDDIQLTYTNTLGEGTWASGAHYPEGNLIIPNGYTLTLQAGTTLYFTEGTSLNVEGRLLANGTQSQRVNFYAWTLNPWLGIKLIDVSSSNDSTLINYADISDCSEHAFEIRNVDKIRISNSTISYNTGLADDVGIGIYGNNADIVLENTNIYNNTTSFEGAAVYFEFSTPRFYNNLIFHNSVTNPGGNVMMFIGCDLSYITDNRICNNFITNSSIAVMLNSCYGSFQQNLIANNGGVGVKSVGSSETNIVNCDIVNNSGTGIVGNGPLAITNCILWGNSPYQFFSNFSPNYCSISYSCVQIGFAGTYNLSSSSYTNNTSSNPLFVSPTAAMGTGYDGWLADWKLQDFSPCIDTGNPAFPVDLDGSIADKGMYPRKLKPLITLAADVTPDQGHQLRLRWNRNDLDETFQPSAFYYIWRWSDSRSESGQFITEVSQLAAIIQTQTEDIFWRDGERTWAYITAVPAVNFADYEVIVPTLQDSSSTGTHAYTYMVMFHNNIGNWQSVPLSGYSVDNIPPAAPDRLDIARTGTGTYNLTWDEVTGGYLDGNFEEEINPITYKVYASDNCDFVPSPANFLLSTTNPFALLTNQTADHRFYKIIASDSE